MRKIGGTFIDLTGTRSGKLAIKSYIGNGIGKWECLCDCGNTSFVRAGSLTRERKPVKSCGCLRKENASAWSKARAGQPRKDLTGMVVGRLTVIEFSGVCDDSIGLTNHRLTWLCSCECGSLVKVRGSSLKCARPTRSCGCLQREYRRTGIKPKACKAAVIAPPKPTKPPRPRIELELKNVIEIKSKPRALRSTASAPRVETTQEFRDWLTTEYNSMKRRCEDDNHPYYDRFGGSGIKVDWDDAEEFHGWVIEDLGLRSVGTKLIRIDRYGNFTPGNLKWVNT